MKNILLIAALFMGALLHAQSEKVLMEKRFEDNSWWIKNAMSEKYEYGGGINELLSGGTKGRFMRIITNGRQVYMINTRSIPVNDGVRLKLEFTLKGKGRMSLNPLGYRKGGSAYLAGGGRMIDSTSWQKVAFTTLFKDPKGKKLETFSVRINIEKNSTLLLESLRITEIR